MKAKTLFLLFFLLFVLQIGSFSQDKYHYPQIPQFIPAYHIIKLPPEIKTTMDSIFPNVVLRYVTNQAEKGDGVGTLQAVFDTRVFDLVKSFNDLILIVHGSFEKTEKLNTENLIKTYAYLQLLMGPYPYIRYNPVTITVSKVEYKYLKSDRPGIPDSLRSFNYNAVVDFIGKADFWQQANIYYFVNNNIVESGYGTIKPNSGEIKEFPLW
jgi:hypothetical protein